jgi:hypothetical protein
LTLNDLQALIYKLTVETLLPSGQTWKLNPKHIKVAAITTAMTFSGGKFTYVEIENKLHENLRNRLKNLGKKSSSKANIAERGEFLLYETGAG